MSNTVIDTPSARLTSTKGRRGDSIFTASVTAAGVFVLMVIVAITLFLLSQALPALRIGGGDFFSEKLWFPEATPPVFGIAALVFGTLVSSAVALLLALPIGVAAALFIVEYAPKRLATPIGHLMDLLAAVPSVVYGLWGVIFLVPHLEPVGRLIDATLGFIPFLHSSSGAYGRSLFAASVLLAIMILPIIGALARETFRQVPRADKEAALALGATRWEMLRMSVLPFSRSGLVAAAMLGLGRALGETIAVALVLSATFTINPHILEPGGNTIAANIATKFGEAGEAGRQALIASGLVLFALTLLVNAAARLLVRRTTRMSR